MPILNYDVSPYLELVNKYLCLFWPIDHVARKDYIITYDVMFTIRYLINIFILSHWRKTCLSSGTKTKKLFPIMV